jgi:hypothetical protein
VRLAAVATASWPPSAEDSPAKTTSAPFAACCFSAHGLGLPPAGLLLYATPIPSTLERSLLMSHKDLFSTPKPVHRGTGRRNAPTLPELADRVNRLHDELRLTFETAIRKAWEIGQALQEAKQRLGHGDWLPWVQNNCPFSHDKATKYMKIFQENSDLEGLLEKVPEDAKLRTVRNLTVHQILTFLAQDDPSESSEQPPHVESVPQRGDYATQVDAGPLFGQQDTAKPPKESPAEPKPASAEPAPVRDGLGRVVPEKLVDVFTSTVVTDFLDRLHTLHHTLSKNRPLYFHFHREEVWRVIGDLEAIFEESQPHIVCETCVGAGVVRGHKCSQCLQAGYLSLGMYQSDLNRIPEPDWEMK